MKIKSTFIAALLAVVLSFTLIDPFHISSGKYDSNPYTEIAAELNKSSTTGVLVLASYNDYYKVNWISIKRSVGMNGNVLETNRKKIGTVRVNIFRIIS